VKNKIRYATLWERFLALLVDFLLFCACFFPITRIVKGVWLMAPNDHNWVNGWFISDPICLIFLVIMVLYMVLLESYGITLGKYLFGLRVVKEDGSRPGLRKSIMRNVLRVVDSLPTLNILGVILILRSGEHARFGDRIAGTRVVHVR
jgi:uncharacterized RDD family membrane protein YckC